MKKILHKLEEWAFLLFTTGWSNYFFIAMISLMALWLAFIIYKTIKI